MNVLEPALEVGWVQTDGFEKIGLATAGPSLGNERCDHEGFGIMAGIFEDAVDELGWKRHLGEKGWPRGPESRTHRRPDPAHPSTATGSALHPMVPTKAFLR